MMVRSVCKRRPVLRAMSVPIAMRQASLYALARLPLRPSSTLSLSQYLSSSSLSSLLLLLLVDSHVVSSLRTTPTLALLRVAPRLVVPPHKASMHSTVGIFHKKRAESKKKEKIQNNLQGWISREVDRAPLLSC